MKKSSNPMNTHPWGMELFFKIKAMYHVINIYPAGQKVKRQSERLCKCVYVFNRLLKKATEQFNSLGLIPQWFKTNVYYRTWRSSCGICLFTSCVFPLTLTSTHWIRCCQTVRDGGRDLMGPVLGIETLNNKIIKLTEDFDFKVHGYSYPCFWFLPIHIC